MHLIEAKLCLNDDEIYVGEACPRCGGAVYWWMSKFVKVMHRERVDKVEEKEREQGRAV